MDTQTPPFFNRGPSPFARLCIFFLLSLLLLISDSRYKYLETARNIVSIPLYFLEQVAVMPVAALERIGDFFVTQSRLMSENNELTQKALSDSMQLQNYAVLQSENNYLRKLLELKEHFDAKAVAAEILYTARDPFSQKIIINKGSYHEIKPGQAVLDDKGVVGQVTRVYPLMSEITLLTEKDHAVPVQVLRSGLRSILFGQGGGSLPELRFIPVNADIQMNDVLVTSGIDEVYPPGLPVAIVSSIERDAALAFAKINTTPIAGVSSSQQLLVLTQMLELPARPQAEDSKTPAAKSKKAKRRVGDVR
jgi:rod shape-determining protein MreC